MSEKLLINDIKSNNSEFKSNNSEKQIIEEMAEILKAYTKKNNIMASHVILECYAEELYSKNYRKQKVGAWIVEEDDNGYAVYRCPKCHCENVSTRSYCPECGAKMKGENDGRT